MLNPNSNVFVTHLLNFFTVCTGQGQNLSQGRYQEAESLNLERFIYI